MSPRKRYWSLLSCLAFGFAIAQVGSSSSMIAQEPVSAIAVIGPQGGEGPVAIGTTDSDVASWLAEIELIRSGMASDRLPEIEPAESELVRAVDEARRSLERTTNEAEFDRWMQYYDFETLENAITEDESVSSKGRAALRLRPQMRGVESGLEMPAMLALRTALDRYIAALRYSDPGRGMSLVNRQLDGLVDLLSSDPPMDLDLSSEQRDQMELFLKGLADAGQAFELTQMIQTRYGLPNFYAYLNGAAITGAIARPVNNPEAVNDCILGTRLFGQAQLTGNVTASLLPQDGYVRLLLRLDGQFSTTTRGFRKPITLDTTGTSPVYCARQLAITQTGMVLGEPITTADLSTRIQRINHPLKIVRNIAMRKARESKPLAESISERKLRRKVQKGFVEETERAAQAEFPDMDAIMNPWLRRLDFPDVQRTIGSTTDEVYVNGKMQLPLGLAAPDTPPAATITRRSIVDGNGHGDNGYLATVQVHETIVGNTFGDLLAGQSFTPDRIRRIVDVLGFELSELPERPNVDIEIDFANFRPVYFEADQQRLRLGLRATRLSRDGRELKVPVEVTATYRPATDMDGKTWLIRDADIQFSFSSSRRLSLGQTAIKANLEEGFEELFPTELMHREITIPDTVKQPAFAGRKLQIRSIDLTNGWISITVR